MMMMEFVFDLICCGDVSIVACSLTGDDDDRGVCFEGDGLGELSKLDGGGVDDCRLHELYGYIKDHVLLQRVRRLLLAMSRSDKMHF